MNVRSVLVGFAVGCLVLAAACGKKTCDASTGQCSQTAQQACQSQGKCVKLDGKCGDDCSDGCCIAGDPTGSCQRTANQSLCGKSANVCAACRNGTCAAVTGGFECQDGSGPLGRACASDSDCEAATSGLSCRMATAENNANYPGGFCTRPCSSQDACASGTCVGLTNFGESALCLPNCASASDCRTGYACYDLGGAPTDPGACWLSPVPVADGGTPSPAGVPGKACTQDSQCGPPPDQQPFCFPEVDASGHKSGYPGGYCYSVCDRDPDHVCGSTGVCLPGAMNLCYGKCAGPMFQAGPAGGCRTGYYCAPVFDGTGHPLPYGYCETSCNNLQTLITDGGTLDVPLGCDEGFACQANGSCCVTDGGTQCY